jgi:hypothetical protein
MNATTVAVDLAKNVLEHYSPSRLPPAAAELKMNALDATTVTEHDIAAHRARELNRPPSSWDRSATMLEEARYLALTPDWPDD